MSATPAGPLVLASASPRRRELLARAGVALAVAAADVDEAARAGEGPADYAARVAEDKARAVAAGRPPSWVLGADTIVVVDGEVLGKPADRAEAEVMLRRLSGRTHRVITAVCLLAPGGDAHRLVESTEVDVRPLTDDDLEGYLASGEWRGKAGAYAVQGIAAALITAVRGSYTNVVGLPLAEVIALLARLGGPAADLARGEAA